MDGIRVSLIVLALGLVAACAGQDPVASANVAQTRTSSAATTAAQEDVAASVAEATATAEASAAASSEDELICERIQETGTHRRVRRCYTRAERDRMRQESQELIRDVGRPRNIPGESN